MTEPLVEADATAAPVTPESTATTQAPVEPTAVKEPVDTGTPAEPVKEEEFDENSVPETSRENFRKYREKMKAREDELAREKYQERARADEAERRWKESQKPKDVPTDRPTRPKIEDFTKLEDFHAAVDTYDDQLIEWAETKGGEKFQQNLTAQEQQRQAIVRQAAFREKGDKARQKYTDFDAVTRPLIAIADGIPALSAYVDQEPTGTDVLYHLCKNPALLDGLMKMNSFAAQKEILRIEAAITAAPTKTQTKAPEPITPVNARTNSPTTLHELAKKDDASDYVARRNREELKKRRGN